MRRLLRDPLAHFLLAGAAIWGIIALAGEPVDPADRSITVTREQQAGLALGFERMMGRPPSDAELEARIAQWVREEVLYREALRLGLDEGDPVVRRRLAAKMDELAGAEAEFAQPAEEVLEAWYRDHRAAYATGGTVSFEQAWFASEEAARAALGQGTPEGEAISLPGKLEGASGEDVGRIFGSLFAEELAQIDPAPRWQGPLRSGFGWHLVRVAGRTPGRLPPLADVRETVERDWRSQTMATRREEAFRVLVDSYRIEVE